jgi:cell division protein FtsW (lipid II flippase)
VDAACRGECYDVNRFWAQLAIHTNWPVLLAVALLSSVGTASIWVDDHAAGGKQLIYMAVAFGCLFAFQTINYRTIGRWVWPFYGFSLLLVLYTLLGSKVSVPFVHGIKGAFCWISFKAGGQEISLEPSELVKISFVLVLARFLRYRSNYRTMTGLLQPFALAIVPVILILKQPDLGIAALFVPTLLVMLFVAGARVKHIVTVLALGVAFMPIFWFAGPRYDSDQPDHHRLRKLEVPVLRYLPSLMKEYQRGRVLAMLAHDPHAAKNEDFQVNQALAALGSGGWFGKGFGQIPTGRRVPEAHDDMIFALIGEQFGLVGAAVVVAAYLILFTAGIEIAAATKEPFGRLIAVGIVALLACQSTINLMVCLRMMPVTGVTLPFISYGGSSLIASYMAAGLLLNVGQNRPLTLGKEAFEFDDDN